MTLVTTQNTGYLEDPYLDEPYLGGSNFGNSGIQFLAIIEAEDPYGTQFEAFIGTERYYGLQFLGVIEDDDAEGVQFHGTLNTERPYGLQFQAVVTDDGAFGIEFRADQSIAHFSECQGESGYLEEPYLSGPYLVATSCAHMGIQFNASINTEAPYGLQFQGVIEDQDTEGAQFRGIINATNAYGVQFDSLRAAGMGLQFQVVLYNTDNLRILCDFASRGTTGKNWTANSTAPGDFSPYNLNTDIVEQVWRSNGTVVGLQLTCDTEIAQGVFFDTLAILNHNMTTSATVTLLGSNDPAFGTIGVTIPLQVINEENLYYIAPEFPTQGFRYWRFLIDDVLTHPDGFIQIGAIVFGASVIFQGECFVDEVDFGFKDFADTVRTAGHTNVANSRALKKQLGLEFRFLRFNLTNFRQMRAMFRDERTVLKCLWIPTPDPDEQEYTARFAVFGKLVTIPRERHKVLSRDGDYVSFPIEVDESL